MSKEGFAQHALASLLVGEEAPRENRPAKPTARGAEFLAELYRTCFGQAVEEPPTFWQEIKMDRIGDTKGAYIDVTARWRDALMLIELKTDTKSTQAGQLGRYLTLGRAHYPDLDLGLLMIAPPAARAPAPEVGGTSYARIDWPETMEVVDRVWNRSGISDLERAYVTVLRECVTASA